VETVEELIVVLSPGVPTILTVPLFASSAMEPDAAVGVKALAVASELKTAPPSISNAGTPPLSAPLASRITLPAVAVPAVDTSIAPPVT
jgi:hypothetical protein